MSLTNDQRLALQTNLARDHAEALLAGLLRAQQEALARAEHGPTRAPEEEAGHRAMERAVAAARRMVENLNAALAMAQHGLTDDASGGDRGEGDGDGPHHQAGGPPAAPPEAPRP